MPLTLRTASPATDPGVVPLIEAAFGRAGRESVLAQRIASGLPTFDPGLALIACRDGLDVGWALFLPRKLWIRGAWVELAVSAPFATLPTERGRGVGTYLMQAGLQGLADRKVRGAVVLSDSSFFARLGFTPAFNLYTIPTPADLLPRGSDDWQALTQSDIPALRELYEGNYAALADVDGTEQRTEAALDWESSVPESFTLVLRTGARPSAYLRFRVRERLEIAECAVRDEAAVEAVLRFFARLLDEHPRGTVDVHLPPAHPVSRALFHLGAALETSNFGGACLLRVADWQGILEDTATCWERALVAGGADAVSLAIGARVFRLRRTTEGLRVELGAPLPGRHVHLPPEWASALLTGQRGWRELEFHAAARERSDLDALGRTLLPYLFPERAPMWTYSPIFEIADD